MPAGRHGMFAGVARGWGIALGKAGGGQARGHPTSRRRAAAGSGHSRGCAALSGRRSPSKRLGGRDRWDRRSVRLQADADGKARDLAQGLVEAGLALADAGRLAGRTARTIFCRRGRPRDSEALVSGRMLVISLSASISPTGLRSESAPSLLVEGRVRSVGERAQRTYLNFGGRWAEDFTVIIPKKDLEADDGARPRRRGVPGTACQGPRHFGGLARRVPYR